MSRFPSHQSLDVGSWADKVARSTKLHTSYDAVVTPKLKSASALAAYLSLMKKVCERYPAPRKTPVMGSCGEAVFRTKKAATALFQDAAGMDNFISNKESARNSAWLAQDRPQDPTWDGAQTARARSAYDQAVAEMDQGIEGIFAKCVSLMDTLTNVEHECQF